MPLRGDGQLVRGQRYAEAALANFAPYGAGAAEIVEKTQRLIAKIDEERGK